MERQKETLVQQKPWEEMTEEERQVVRESWKHKLPEKFDVFFVGNFNYPSVSLEIPGNVYCPEFMDVADLTIDGDLIVDDEVSCGDVIVHGSFIVKGFVDCLEVNVDDLFDCDDVNSWCCPIKASDYVCRFLEEQENA